MGGLWISPVSPYNPEKRKKGIFTSRMRDEKCQYPTSLHFGSGGTTGNTKMNNYTLFLNNYASLRFGEAGGVHIAEVVTRVFADCKRLNCKCRMGNCATMTDIAANNTGKVNIAVVVFGLS